MALEADWLKSWIEVDSIHAKVSLDSFEQRVIAPDRFTEFYKQPCFTQKLLSAATGDSQ